jgi:hypothetical protein
VPKLFILVNIAIGRIKVSIGKLYRLSDDQFVAYVNYRLFHHDTATNWWGELTLIDNVHLNEDDRFMIELEDKRKSQCHLKKRVNRAVSGFPVRWIYHITGTSQIE